MAGYRIEPNAQNQTNGATAACICAASTCSTTATTGSTRYGSPYGTPAAACRAFDATPRAPRNCSGKWRPNSVPLTARYRESVLDEFYRLCVELAAGDGIPTVSRQARVGVIFTFVLPPV
jgi:hypothetical protein